MIGERGWPPATVISINAEIAENGHPQGHEDGLATKDTKTTKPRTGQWYAVRRVGLHAGRPCGGRARADKRHTDPTPLVGGGVSPARPPKAAVERPVGAIGSDPFCAKAFDDRRRPRRT